MQIIAPNCKWSSLVTICHLHFNFFNSVQLAPVLEDYEPPALRVQGFVSRKKGARSIVEEKKEGGGEIIIIINKS